MSEISYKVFDLADDTQYVQSCLNSGTDLFQALAQLDVMQRQAEEAQYERELFEMHCQTDEEELYD